MDFKEYLEQIQHIKKCYDYEQYYDELLRPLFLESIIGADMTEIMLVPTFDTRARSETIRENYKDVTGRKEDGRYVWPDYIFVPKSYTMKKPLAPYAKVEFKIPNIDFENGIYYPLPYSSKGIIDEIYAENYDCPLIYTDGLSWCVIERNTVKEFNKVNNEENNILKNNVENNAFMLIKVGEKIKSRGRNRGCDYKEFDDATAKQLFCDLKEKIKEFIKAATA